MKKNTFLLLISIFAILSSCENKKKEQLVGIWRMQEMNINGTSITNSSLGNWLWEFNEEGGYLINLSGETEKGVYVMKDSTLILDCKTNKEKPDAVFHIAHLDSLNLRLESKTEQNTSSFVFIKTEGEPVGEVD